MTTIEIRHRRMPLILLIIVLSVSVLIYAYLIFILDVFKGQTYGYAILGVATIIVLNSIYKAARRLRSSEPEIRFSLASLEIKKKGKLLTYPWQQIIQWKVDQDEKNHYLVIQTSGGSISMDITWLDKKPAEIAVLMQQYKK
ncbi:MAG TPA: hypothetical protein VHM26_17060 [Chitinophagaceae bacterium]|nr:hypothetical protein [Chitinophagaceae bacterium]